MAKLISIFQFILVLFVYNGEAGYYPGHHILEMGISPKVCQADFVTDDVIDKYLKCENILFDMQKELDDEVSINLVNIHNI